MATPTSITRGPPAHPGLDYTTLRSDALSFIEQIAGANWTDYNAHDPGVTTLEQLCYALTELSYRAGSNVSDLLADTHGHIDTRRQALHGPRRILPSEPLTPNDYRRLLIDRVPGLGNAWIVPRMATAPGDLDALWDIVLYAPPDDPSLCECVEASEPLRRQALGVYARHRALCEDVRHISVLRSVRTTLHAVAIIDAGEAPERVMAELLYRAGRTLVPEVRRRSLASLLEQGRNPSSIFEGPLLRNGFIDDDELGPRPERIRVADLVRVMAACPGVRSVNELIVRVGRATFTTADAGEIPVPSDAVLQLDVGLESRTLPIRLVRHGSVCVVEPARVRQELNRLWRAHRQTYPLGRDYAQAFGVLRGKHHDLAQYSSVQNQYPRIYGIGRAGLASDATPFRRAQAKQLQGYLMVFEQILADYFAQLAHARDLLSTDPTLDRTYFGQSLVEIVPGAKELLVDPDDVEQLRQKYDPAVARRNRFLDLLLALYAEDANRGRPDDARAAQAVGGERSIRVKLDLLARLVATTRLRSRGFDYLAAPSARNVSGLELRSRIELGMDAGHGDAATIESAGRLYVVEHVLLRAARHLGRASSPTGDFEYNFMASALICAPAAHDTDFRHRVAQVLARNAPAHLVISAYFLDPARMRSFETMLRAWREALVSRVPRAMVTRSLDLRDFLTRCASERESSESKASRTESR